MVFQSQCFIVGKVWITPCPPYMSILFLRITFLNSQYSPNGFKLKTRQNHIKLEQYKPMQKKGLTATSFLRSNEVREKYQCGICYEVCIKPVRCKGQCSKIFCMKCVSDIRQDVDRCPYKCSSPFLVQRISDIQLDFFCPYNPTACPIPIKSLASFEQHYRVCQFASPEERHLKKMQEQYKCLHGHQLEFFIGSYEEMVQSSCVACGEAKLCRSLCRICDQYYCVACRVPPCAKSSCPLGHQFSFQRISNLNFICDICGVSTAVSNDGVYDDSLCNFGICQGCFSELPDKFDESKPRELVANINTHCSCGTKLDIINALYHTVECQLCRRHKECPKRCPNCAKTYCISCKLIDVNRDGTCGFQHQLQRYDMIDFQGFAQKQQYYGCMRCGRPQEVYYQDKVCNTRLCETCLGYCQSVTIDKQRPIILKCSKNHVLTYVTGPEDWYDHCVECQQHRIIRLRCNYCEEQGVSYCFQCKPITLETCYYKHKLRMTHFQSSRECQICMKITNQFHHCKKCFFYACKQCVQVNGYIKEISVEPELEKIEKYHHQSQQIDCGMQVEAYFLCRHEEPHETFIFDEE